MADPYVPGDMSRLYQQLEGFVKQEFDALANEGFYREKPASPEKLNWEETDHKPLAREWLRVRDEILADRLYHNLKRPPLVHQAGRPICWAAATESWLKAVNHPRAMNKDALRKKFASDPSGALTISLHPSLRAAGVPSPGNELSTLLAYFGTMCQLIAPYKITYNYLYEHFKTEGHLLMFVGSGSDMGHAYVVYGVFLDDSNGMAKIKVMDPMSGANGRVLLRDFRPLSLVVAWMLRMRILGGSGSPAK